MIASPKISVLPSLGFFDGKALDKPALYEMRGAELKKPQSFPVRYEMEAP